MRFFGYNFILRIRELFLRVLLKLDDRHSCRADCRLQHNPLPDRKGQVVDVSNQRSSLSLKRLIETPATVRLEPIRGDQPGAKNQRAAQHDNEEEFLPAAQDWFAVF